LQELQKLEVNRYRLQLHTHLDRCRISQTRIVGVGDAKKATLQSYGIETAADIVDSRVLAVPGFGPVLFSNLKRWREQQERRFAFDPNKGVDQTAKNDVERQILTEKVALERKLNEGLSKLTVSSHHILTRRQALVAQAEHAAHDLAQAEADLRASSAISPIMPGKPAILALGAILIGGYIVASYQGERPSAVTSPQIQPQPIQPQQPSPLSGSQVSPGGQTLPPHVEKDASGQSRPEDGYDWSDSNQVSVRWKPGKISWESPHLFASSAEGGWEPEDGYNWAESTNFRNKAVKWVPGIASNRYPNIVAAAMERQWRPAEGYAWISNPPLPGDMRVKQLARPEGTLPTLLPENPFQRGLADRTGFEQWVVALSDDFRGGAEWWAGHRSLPDPGSCNGPAAISQNFVFGCEAAKARLTPTDLSRKSDPEYRRGWNSYAGPIEPPSGPAFPPAQTTIDTPGDADEGSASRLNAQELKRLGGQ
jgi:hypothetical protein